MTVLYEVRQAGPLLRRGACFGAVGGFIIGGAAGTWVFPFVGTFLWGLAGAGLGVPVGMGTALAIPVLIRLFTPRWMVVLGAAVVAGCLAAVLMSVVQLPGEQPGGLGALVVAAGVLGAGIGPPIAFGSGTATRSRWPDDAALVALAKPMLLRGLIGGSAVGALVGLGIGLVTYLPTAPVAMVEGGLLGATAGIFVGLIVLVAAVGIRMWVRP